MHLAVTALGLLVSVTGWGLSTPHKHRHRRFMHNSRFRTVDKVRKKTVPDDRSDSLNGTIIGYNEEKTTDVFVSKNNQFILRCPKPAEEHWEKKINFTVVWSLDGLRYFTIVKRNLFPRLEFINHYAKILKQHRRRNTSRFKFPYLSVQQWPNIDGKSASAIVYLNPDSSDDRPISPDGIAAGRYYKFEAEERRQWFVLRIPRPRPGRDQGLWECRMVVHLNEQVIRLESRRTLTGPTKQRHHSRPYVEFQNTPKRKTRRMNVWNEIHGSETHSGSQRINEDDDVKFTFACANSDDPTLVIARGAAPPDVQFSRNDADVQFTREDFYAYHNPVDPKHHHNTRVDDMELNEDGGVVPEKLLTPPTTDGLLWSRWWSHSNDNDEDDREIRRHWWQNSAEFNGSVGPKINLVVHLIELSFFAVIITFVQ